MQLRLTADGDWKPQQKSGGFSYSGKRVCNGPVSVRLSVPSIDSSSDAQGWFAAARARAADIDRRLPALRTGYRWRSVDRAAAGSVVTLVRGSEDRHRVVDYAIQVVST